VSEVTNVADKKQGLDDAREVIRSELGRRLINHGRQEVLRRPPC